MALGKIRPAEDRVRDALLAAMADPSYEVASAAIDGLGDLGADGEPAIPALVARLGRGDQANEVTEALGRIRRRPDLVIPAMFRVPTNASAASISAFGRESLPHLEAALESASHSSQWIACQALVELGALGVSLAPALVRGMAREPNLTWVACKALQAMGLKADVVLPDLQRLVAAQDPELGDPWVLLETIGMFGSKGLPALLALSEERADGVRTGACVALVRHHRSAPETRARLTALAGDASNNVRRVAEWGLKDLDRR